MATIEERANELYCDADGYVKDSANDYMRLGFIVGANKMVVKACSKFCDQCNFYYAFVHGKDCSLDRAICAKLNNFRKSLED